MRKLCKSEREPDSLDTIEEVMRHEEEQLDRRDHSFTDEQKRWFLGAVILISTTLVVILLWRMWNP